MIVARAEAEGGGAVLVLGLSRRNVDLLLQNKPIQMTPKSHPSLFTGLGLDAVVILGGETEEAMAAWFVERGLIDASTDVTVHANETREPQEGGC